MPLDNIVERVQRATKGDDISPLLVLRVAEQKHRQGGGAQPECIKLGPDFYDAFMNAYKVARMKIPEELRDQMNLERPTIFGIPIICDPASQNDIEFYVPPGGAQRPIIVTG